LEEAKRRRKEIERERKQREKMGLPSYQGIGKGGSMSGTGGPGFTAQQPQILEQRKPEYSPQPAAPTVRKGLQLKKTAAKKDEYLEAMRQETGIDMSRSPDALKASTSEEVAAVPATLKDDVHLEVIEKLLVQLDRDGNLQNMEVRGEFIITVNKQSFDTVAVKLGCNNRAVEFKAHPNMDKNRWANEQVLALRDNGRAYPVGAPTSVLKWRILSNDTRVLPLTVNCWPSTNMDTGVVTLEYELGRAKPYTIKDVSIRIPVVGKSAPKITSAGEGTTDFDARESILTWDIPMLDSKSASGSMEFEIAQWANSRGEAPNVFPIDVKFQTAQSMSDISIDGAAVSGQPVKFSSLIVLSVEKYTIQ
jgi:coatomer subunit delta